MSEKHTVTELERSKTIRDMGSEFDERITFIGRINFRDQRVKFGIKRKDRRFHTYCIGQTGTGKTTLLENLIGQDIRNGEGLAFFDPHGDVVEQIARAIPQERQKDLIYFDIPDTHCPYGFNPLENVPQDKRPFTASGIIEAFKKIWETKGATTWGPRMEHIFRNVLLTLLDQPQATFADIRRLFYDPAYRKEAISKVTNPEVKDFWLREFENYYPRYKIEAINPIQNKVGAFLADPNLFRILAQSKNNLDLRKVMDEGKILLVNLAKGKLGGDNATLIGALLVSRLGLAALSRADQPEEQRRDFYLYLDEFQNFTTLSLSNMLSELRKYRLNMILSHQYLDQLEPEVRQAILGNVGTIICFRIGLKDAQYLEDVFYPKFSRDDLINLGNFNIYLRLVIDGMISKPFSADTLPPTLSEKLMTSRFLAFAVLPIRLISYLVRQTRGWFR